MIEALIADPLIQLIAGLACGVVFPLLACPELLWRIQIRWPLL
jgi:hypothetical protein